MKKTFHTHEREIMGIISIAEGIQVRDINFRAERKDGSSG